MTTGDRAPDFALPTAFGARRSLGDYLSRGPLLLAFHRGSW
jgi:peroxiredoxin